jgi:hypothetical protein
MGKTHLQRGRSEGRSALPAVDRCCHLNIKYIYFYVFVKLIIIQSTINMDVRFRAPFCAIVAGPSGCGKSVFIAKLLSNVEVMITPVPENIMYCYTEYQPMFDEFPHVNFV